MSRISRLEWMPIILLLFTVAIQAALTVPDYTCPTTAQRGQHVAATNTWILSDETLKTWEPCTRVNASLDLSGVTSCSQELLTALMNLREIQGSLLFHTWRSTHVMDGMPNLGSIGGTLELTNVANGITLPELATTLYFPNLIEIGGGLAFQNISSPALYSVFQANRLERLASFLRIETTLFKTLHGGLGSSVVGDDASLRFYPNANTSAPFSLILRGNDRLQNLLGLDALDGAMGDLILECSEGLPCPYFESLASLDGVTSVAGDVRFVNLCKITNFFPGLSTLQSVGGTLLIDRVGTGCPTKIPIGFNGIATGYPSPKPMYLGLDAFRSLTQATSISIRNTYSDEIFGFEGIWELRGGLEIHGNIFLKYLNGFSSLEDVGGDILIEDNPSLEHLDGFSSLISINGNAYIKNNTMLRNIDGFGAVTNLGANTQIVLVNNIALESVAGLCGVSSVFYGNTTVPSGPNIIVSGPAKLCRAQMDSLIGTWSTFSEEFLNITQGAMLPINLVVNDTESFASETLCEQRAPASMNCSCEAVTNRCLNNGTCTSVRSLDVYFGVVYGYSCACAVDSEFGLWNGPICSSNNVTCVSDPCFPGVGCVDVVDTFTPSYGRIDSRQCNYCPPGLIGGGTDCVNATEPAVLACIPPYQTDSRVLENPLQWIKSVCASSLFGNMSVQLILFNFDPTAMLDVEVNGIDVPVSNVVWSAQQVAISGDVVTINITTLMIPIPPNNRTGHVPLTVTNMNLPSQTTTRYDAISYTASNCYASGLWLTHEDECLSCPSNAQCRGGGQAWPDPGYWSQAASYPPLACDQRPTSCPGALEPSTPLMPDGVTRVTSNCAEGYNGTVCSECADGFYKDYSVCRSCGFEDSDLAQLITLLTLASIFYLSIAGLVAWLGDWRLGCLVGWIVFFQQLIAIVQTGAAALNTGNGGWAVFVSEVIRVISIVNFDLAILKPGCTVPRLSFIGVFGATILFFLLVLALFMIASATYARWVVSEEFMRVRGWTRWDAYKERTVHALYIFGYMVYLQMTTRIFQGIICQNLNGTSVLLADPSVQCYQGMHRFVGAVCWILLFVYGVGFPLYCQHVLRSMWLPRLKNLFDNPQLAARAVRASSAVSRNHRPSIKTTATSDPSDDARAAVQPVGALRSDDEIDPAAKGGAITAHQYYDGFDKWYYLYRGTRMPTYWFRNLDCLTNFMVSLTKSLSKNIPLALFFQGVVFFVYFVCAGILRPYRSVFENWTSMFRGIGNGGQACFYLLLLKTASYNTSQGHVTGVELFVIDFIIFLICLTLVLIARRPELRRWRKKILEPFFTPYFLTEEEEMIVSKGGILPNWKKHLEEMSPEQRLSQAQPSQNKVHASNGDSTVPDHVRDSPPSNGAAVGSADVPVDGTPHAEVEIELSQVSHAFGDETDPTDAYSMQFESHDEKPMASTQPKPSALDEEILDPLPRPPSPPSQAHGASEY